MKLIRLMLLPLLFALPAGALDLHRKPANGTELLSAEDAFPLVSVSRDGDALRLSWNIAPGYYLYRQRFAVEPVDGAGPLAALQLPHGTPKHDEHFGAVEIYTGRVDARLPIAPGTASPARLKLRWQGCAEAGVCYPPITRVVDVTAAP